jgi:phytoene dehydrogenase-like protein
LFLLDAALAAQHGGAAGVFRGGLGALTQAIAAAAREAGAEIRTDADVVRINVTDGTASGVVLANGEDVAADALVCNADPRHTFLSLVDPVHLEPGFQTKIRNFRCTGVTAKVNLALEALPTFTALDSDAASAPMRLSGRIHIGPDIDYLERAFDDSKYGRFSREPYLDVAIPTLTDPTLAPTGHHVMSICMQYAPYQLRQTDWPHERDALQRTVIQTLARFAPDIEAKIAGVQVITPLDLERTYGLTHGAIYHGDLALDQLFTMRPLIGWAQYRTPIRHLYLCGAGTHPGVGITGASGANASREVIRDLRTG